MDVGREADRQTKTLLELARMHRSHRINAKKTTKNKLRAPGERFHSGPLKDRVWEAGGGEKEKRKKERNEKKKGSRVSAAWMGLS